MRVTLGMIVLNEAEYLARNLLQHYPLVDQIIVVEGADRLYPKSRVTINGLSIDGTAEIIRSFPDPDRKITPIQHGWTTDRGAQAKTELRNRYLELCKPGLLAVIDADEFYRREDFAEIIRKVHESSSLNAWRYPIVHFWRTDKQFITGGYYDVPHTRFWRIRGGERYVRDHNIPERNGVYLNRLGAYEHERHIRTFLDTNYYVAAPCCYHYGFCKAPQNMLDKTDYYQARGEGNTRRRTTQSRAAWFRPDSELPKLGLQLWNYGGPLPEVFGSTEVLAQG